MRWTEIEAIGIRLPHLASNVLQYAREEAGEFFIGDAPLGTKRALWSRQLVEERSRRLTSLGVRVHHWLNGGTGAVFDAYPLAFPL